MPSRCSDVQALVLGALPPRSADGLKSWDVARRAGLPGATTVRTLRVLRRLGLAAATQNGCWYLLPGARG